MLRKLSVLLVAWLCYATTRAQALHPEPVKITAQLIHADSSTPRAMVFNFLNPFIRLRKSAAFDEHNLLASSGEMIFTQNMTIQYNNTFINLYVQPGDSVHLQIDGALLKNKNFEWLSISGDHATESTQVNLWHHYFSRYTGKAFQQAGSLTTMKDSAVQEYARCLAMLENYSKQYPLLPAVKKWVAIDIRNTISYWASDNLTAKDSITGRLILNHALYREPLFDQYNEIGFQSMMFPYHLANYTHTLLKTDSVINNLQQHGRYAEAAKRALRLLSGEPKSLARDYMLFNFINTLLPRSPQLADSLPALPSLFHDTLTYAYLLRAAGNIQHPVVNERPVAGISYFNNGRTETVPPVEVLAYLAKKYPGKVLYIDIYATWCVPCFKEMEKMPEIKAGVDTSKIVFINICLQSEIITWSKLVKSKKHPGEHYFLDEDATKIFMGMYAIEGFPSYFLLNKKGQVETLKAPRPSDGTMLINRLNRLIR